MAPRKNPAPENGSASPSRLNTSVQGGLLLLIGFVCPIIPRADVALFLMLGLLSVFYFFFDRDSWSDLLELPRDRWLPLIFLSLAIYLHINAIWAPDVGVALKKAITFSVTILVAWTIARSFGGQPENAAFKATTLFIIGFAAGAGFECIEYLSGHAWREALYLAWPSLRPGDNTISVIRMLGDGGYALLTEEEYGAYLGHDIEINYQPSAANRNVTLILLFLWPALLLGAYQKDRIRRTFAFASIGTTSILAIALSASQTVQAALILSVSVFFAARYVPRLMHALLVGGWCLVLVFAIPLALLPYKLDLHNSDWLFESAQDRVRIWDLTARMVTKAPIFGTGIRATRFKSKDLIEKRAAKREPGDSTLPARLGRHAHNHFLQIWYELGAVGAALFLALGLALLRLIKGLSGPVRPYAHAAFSAACVIAAFGWGLWQTWLLAGYALAIVLIGLAACFSRSQEI